MLSVADVKTQVGLEKLQSLAKPIENCRNGSSSVGFVLIIAGSTQVSKGFFQACVAVMFGFNSLGHWVKLNVTKAINKQVGKICIRNSIF